MVGDKMTDPNRITPLFCDPQPNIADVKRHSTPKFGKTMRGLAQICNLDKQKAAFMAPKSSPANQQA